MSKLRVAVIFGGASSEYEISLLSATSVLKNIPADRYDILKLGITKEGAWYLYNGPVSLIAEDKWQEKRWITPAVLSPDRVRKGILSLHEEDSGTGRFDLLSIDCLFPVLHGKNGEDGTIQGLFELSGIPYVGCDVISSANCMDKTVTHSLLESAGIPTAKWRTVLLPDLDHFSKTALDLEEALGYPMFVKPANAGSSVGVSKAKNREELHAALELAFQHDRKAVVEEFIDGIEAECAVLGRNDSPEASCLGEICPKQEFYSYSAKYSDDSTDLYIPARVSQQDEETARQYAAKAFQVLGCSGLARVDFLIKKDGTGVILNEPNTLPGFTSISMYPKLWEYEGLPYGELLSRLIELAMERAEGR